MSFFCVIANSYIPDSCWETCTRKKDEDCIIYRWKMAYKQSWSKILDFEDQFYPKWRTHKPILLFSTALAGELGELCGTVTHLEGGGTNNSKYTRKMVLEEGVDTYIQLVLLLARYGYNETDFRYAFEEKFLELLKRLEIKRTSLSTAEVES